MRIVNGIRHFGPNAALGKQLQTLTDSRRLALSRAGLRRLRERSTRDVTRRDALKRPIGRVLPFAGSTDWKDFI